MKIVALVSGGKDSCYSMYLATKEGHEVVALANLQPQPSQPDELDSYMYQTVGHQVVQAYSACMGLPLFRRQIKGTSARKDLSYTRTEGDEVEDLFILLSHIKEVMPQIMGVASGAIASDYQRVRVENVCARLNLVSYAYLWHMPQRQLLRGMIECGIEAVLIKVAALGLDPRKHLGRSIAVLEPHLHRLSDLYGSHVCGEGGEYESMTLDFPLFTKGRIVLDETEVVIQTPDAMAPVAYLVPKSFHIEPKDPDAPDELPSDVRDVPDSSSSSCGTPKASFVRTSFGQRPGEYNINFHVVSGQDYVQLSCSAHSRVPADCTENDTANALHDMLAAVERELAAMHLELNHALFVHLFLANMGHFAAANAVYCRHFPAHNPPSRACVQVPLPEGCPVMVDVLLAKGAYTPAAQPAAAAEAPDAGRAISNSGGSSSRSSTGGEEFGRKVLHVQSISSWAPSCIGPYSQANQYNGLVYLAGQIPLHPSSMTVVAGDAVAQTIRALASCEAVAVALRCSVLRGSLGLTVYVTAATALETLDAITRTIFTAFDQGTLPHIKPKRASSTNSPPVSGGTGSGSGGGVAVGGGCANGCGRASGSGSARLSSSGRSCFEDEEGEGDDAVSRLDPYLEPPNVSNSMRPNVTFITVEALPRGSLVELQPVLVDLPYGDILSQRHSHSSADGEENSRPHTQPCSNAKLPTLDGMGVQRHSSIGTCDLSNEDSCHTSTLASDDEEEGPLAARGTAVAAAAAAVAAGSASVPAPAGTSGRRPGSGVAGAGGSGCSSSDAMATSVCHEGRLCKTLLHMPLAVFQARGDLHVRLQRALGCVLASYGMDLSHVVRVMAWYDINKVVLMNDPNTSSSASRSFHVTWVPVLGVTSSACADCAAIMEVLVEKAVA
mmetsp:Transcript_35745/g.79546  ORF Transcript_35745/g.79546 Transcript_35745/m.79546 type:complete len:894 (+) Transcript_35745:147-2828(+)|eukprot:CAMPEP_0202893480 /NCGR_PEP_ID=MMETSP1392-20130828/3061_1 /ASSEMBLY_ACC=CAM_ASM_000868 /TAXON_ID=225041 /ORGANISM="Chlamydomonas chlamydogama, Strain SAG 11-48b" /LENGTH=893 /DNA_ID=CAMNT_0049577829 /DNA_START=89 /DNA_END=2770 /DNA_ORIENTATION=+